MQIYMHFVYETLCLLSETSVYPLYVCSSCSDVKLHVFQQISESCSRSVTMIQTKILQRNEVKTYNIVKAFNVNKYTYIIGVIRHCT